MYIPDWWVWLIVNPVPTDFTIVCVMTHTAVLVVRLHLIKQEKEKMIIKVEKMNVTGSHYLSQLVSVCIVLYGLLTDTVSSYYDM